MGAGVSLAAAVSGFDFRVDAGDDDDDDAPLDDGAPMET